MDKKYLVVTYWSHYDEMPATLSIILIDHDTSTKLGDGTFSADNFFETPFEVFGYITDCYTDVVYSPNELVDTFSEAQKKLIRFVLEF